MEGVGILGGGAAAVDDVSFTVKSGSVTGFPGRNGAGKTTTLRMFLGMVCPDRGRASIGEMDYTDLEAPLEIVAASSLVRRRRGAVRSDGGHRHYCGALLDEFAVNLIINGHNYGCERTHPVRVGVPGAGSAGRRCGRHGAGHHLTSPLGLRAGRVPTGGHPVRYVVEDGGVQVPETAEWSSTSYCALDRDHRHHPEGPNRHRPHKDHRHLPEREVIDTATLTRTTAKPRPH